LSLFLQKNFTFAEQNINIEYKQMKISYNWLKEYLNIDLSAEKLSEILTNIGLEVGGYETYESIKGGMEGLVIAKVKTCKPHNNSDHLSVTTVDLGDGQDTQIVCGASNVAAGQTVVVATVGTTLYSGGDSFVIKKSKIRGEESFGMICGETEIGIGTDDSGIMILPEEIPTGTLAKEYFKIESDTVFEVDLTPNRIDAASHIGVARDIAAYLKQSQSINYSYPDISSFSINNNNMNIEVIVEDNILCPRYSGVCISGIKVDNSPAWLQNRLKAIGLEPINNVVDITNYVLHEYGQPLHAFDAEKIIGNKILVKTLPSKTKFTTLDEVERNLSETDLMICNKEQGMCIAGIFGGIESGVTDSTTSIFLESAYFNPVSVRKTARRHALNTDASFRFERGIDPNNTVNALKRAAILIKEIAGGVISSEITDIYPNPITDFTVNLRLSQVTRLIGENIPQDKIKNILESLEIGIIADNGDSFDLKIPAYRVDVQREADVIEEILRIYGYNTITIPTTINATLGYSESPDIQQMRNIISDHLVAQGFNEIMANSLTKSDYYETSYILKKDKCIKILNPLSQDLNVMRQSLLFGGLEAIEYNSNRQNSDIKFFEFGNCYSITNSESTKVDEKYQQNEILALFVSGNKNTESWLNETKKASFFYIKTITENILLKLGFIVDNLTYNSISNDLLSDGLEIIYQNKHIGNIGFVSKKELKKFGTKQDVFYSELNWEIIINIIKKHKIQFAELPKYPSVRRDLSLLLDNNIKFENLKQLAFKTEKKLLKNVDLFDVYEGNNIGEGKKSYALSFILLDETKTLNDKQIDKIMSKIIQVYEQELGAKLR